MVKPDNYILVYGWMVTELGLKGNELFLYAIIYGFSQDGETEFSGSLRYMQEWLGVNSKATVQNTLEKLMARGLIKKRTVVEKGVTRNFFSAVGRVYQNLVGGVPKNSTGVYQNLVPGVPNFSPNNIEDNIEDSVPIEKEYSGIANALREYIRGASDNDLATIINTKSLPQGASKKEWIGKKVDAHRFRERIGMKTSQWNKCFQLPQRQKLTDNMKGQSTYKEKDGKCDILNILQRFCL